MRLLGLAVAIFGIVSGVAGYEVSDPTLDLLTAASLIVAYCCERSNPMSPFLKIFLALFSVETIVFGLGDFAGRLGYWPQSLEEARLPPTLALTVAMGMRVGLSPRKVNALAGRKLQ